MPVFSKVLVVGLGKVGELVARLLQSTGLDVVGADLVAPVRPDAFPFPVFGLDITDDPAVRRALESTEAVVSCLPFRFNRTVVEAAASVGVHYFDLSEDVAVTARMMELVTDTVFAPHCGLAPGLICMAGAWLAGAFDTLQSMELKVGALPRSPSGLSVTPSTGRRKG